MGATLDGVVENSGAIFEAKFMLPWSFSEEAAVEKHMPQLQHNMLVASANSSVLSIITGGGKWIELKVEADAIYQAVLFAAEAAFWDAVQTGKPPQLLGTQAPIPRIAALRVIDMTASNAWAEFSAIYARTRAAHADHEAAKCELKRLIPSDAKEAFGHGLRAKRSRNGAVSFDLVESV
jgi:predicted phage-related endonuclease